MAQATLDVESATAYVVLHSRMSDEEFFELCAANSELRLERTAQGDIIVMPPAGGESGRRNFNLTGQLAGWAAHVGNGVGFDSSTGFRLPNGATRAPDASWVAKDRWESLPRAERERFVPLCPDLVVELRSPSDRIKDCRAKMEEYVANGARLGWLIDPGDRRVYVYRPGAPVEQLDDPASVAGDPVLPGFVLDLAAIW